MKKILLFGASGNMGGYMAEYFLQNLPAGYEVIGVDRVANPAVEKMIRIITMDFTSFFLIY